MFDDVKDIGKTTQHVVNKMPETMQKQRENVKKEPLSARKMHFLGCSSLR